MTEQKPPWAGDQVYDADAGKEGIVTDAKSGLTGEPQGAGCRSPGHGLGAALAHRYGVNTDARGVWAHLATEEESSR